MTFDSTKLNNGLTVLTYHMPYVQSVSINIIVKVGSRYETIKQSGISHFLEHMAFKGTKTRTAKNIAEQFDCIGGHFNAYTSREQTVYYAKVLKDHIYEAMEILADILQNSVFAEEDIKKEYQVILQEIAGVNDDPDDLAYEKLYEVAYKNHPLGKSILGNATNLANFTGESFKDYLATHYTADNMFVSIAGNIEHELAVKYVQELFTELPGSSSREQFEPSIYQGGTERIVKELEQTTVLLGFESCSYMQLVDFYHTQIMSLILGGGFSSRLFQEIRENLGLAYSVGTCNNSYYDSGLFSIYASTSHDKVQTLIKHLNIELDKIKQHVNEQELARAKAQIKASIYMSEEKSAYKSEEIGKYFAIFGRYFSVQEIMRHIDEATCQDILNIARKIFSNNKTLITIGEYNPN